MRCRVMHDGLGAGADQVARDAALLAACRRGRDAALRLYRTTPTASIGAFDAAPLAVRRDYCAAHGIPVVRRLSGGGAVYVDPGQLGWSLAVRLRKTLPAHAVDALMAHFCTAVADALQTLDVPARYRYPNDIEVNGRKVASGFLAVYDDALLFQGTVLQSVDSAVMLRVLRTPTEKLTEDGIRSARERLITLNEITGDGTSDAALQEGLARALSAAIRHAPTCGAVACAGEVASAGRPVRSSDLWEEGGDALRAWMRTTGGVLHAALTMDATATRIRTAQFAGAIHLRPADALARLAAALAGQRIAEVEAAVRNFFRTTAWDAIGVGIEDVVRLVRRAVARLGQQRNLGLSLAQANTLMVHACGAHDQADAIARDAGVMLVPYCAKPPHCKWRNLDGCTECGACEVGDAYRLARERGMRVVSINNFEHLQETLEAMRDDGVRAYVGMCCAHFYLKRQHAFDAAGIPAVLMDITGSNCYELQQEDAAYAGTFKAQSHLNVEVLEKVMRHTHTPDAVYRGYFDKETLINLPLMK